MIFLTKKVIVLTILVYIGSNYNSNSTIYAQTNPEENQLKLYKTKKKQSRLTNLMDVKNTAQIPFQYINNLIVIDVTINKVFPLKFIFDTGAEYTVLTKREITDVLGVRYHRKIALTGADLNANLFAYLARGIHIQVGELASPSHSLLVLEDDYVRFEELLGVKVHGIIGADFFRFFVVKIDYKKRLITMQRPKHFRTPPSNKYSQLPLTFSRNKPYLDTHIQSVSDTSKSIRLLLDTGAALPLLLHTNTTVGIRMPPSVVRGTVGRGLTGSIEGFIGRSKSLALANHELYDVVTNYQEINRDIVDTTLLNGRDGIVGNGVLNRFTIIIDYVNEQLYLKPNKRLEERFRYDRSGIILIASGKELSDYIVYDVILNSPAYEAGIRPQDKILSFNGWPIGVYSLQGIIYRLQHKKNKKIKLKVLRGDKEVVKTSFYLRDLL